MSGLPPLLPRFDPGVQVLPFGEECAAAAAQSNQRELAAECRISQCGVGDTEDWCRELQFCEPGACVRVGRSCASHAPQCARNTLVKSIPDNSPRRDFY